MLEPAQLRERYRADKAQLLSALVRWPAAAPARAASMQHCAICPTWPMVY